MNLGGKHYMIEGGTGGYTISFHFLNPKLRVTCSKNFLNNVSLSIRNHGRIYVEQNGTPTRTVAQCQFVNIYNALVESHLRYANVVWG